MNKDKSTMICNFKRHVLHRLQQTDNNIHGSGAREVTFAELLWLVMLHYAWLY